MLNIKITSSRNKLDMARVCYCMSMQMLVFTKILGQMSQKSSSTTLAVNLCLYHQWHMCISVFLSVTEYLKYLIFVSLGVETVLSTTFHCIHTLATHRLARSPFLSREIEIKQNISDI